MRAFVTGASGFVGYALVKLLAEKGFHVRALVRDLSGAAPLKALGAELVLGDIREARSLCAVKGCAVLFHAAADYRLWVPDPEIMYGINVQGTRNVMEAALRHSVDKVVYTSTVGVLRTPKQGGVSDETSGSRIDEMTGHYKRTKFLAEQEVSRLVQKGLPAVIVNPSTPIGPMDRKPTPTGKVIVDFLSGRMPAYLDTGLNFICVDDVAAGHLLASINGKAGERYILGNRNMTLKEFLGLLARLTGRKPPAIRLPYLPVLLAAKADEAVSRLLKGREPRIPVSGVRMAGKYMFFDPSKAVRELGLPQSPIEGALERAVAWFEENGYVKRGSSNRRRRR